MLLNASYVVGLLCPSSPPSPSPNSTLLNNPSLSMASSARIAVVGDVHNDWDLAEDSKALQFLQPDVVLFTGDFGEENVELVRNIADLQMPKAVILGNHDAWFTQKFSNNLGEEHVGYKHLDFPMFKMSVVGGRPFSCGGHQLFRKRLLSARYGVSDMDGSAQRILKAATRVPEDHSIIFLAHNGPTGLGSKMDDICGRDWVHGGGDHGDPDLAQAIALIKETTKYKIPLVVFGHMHKGLAYGGARKMINIGPDNTVYLNGAIVPRVKRFVNEAGGTVRAFALVELCDGKASKIAETWVSVVGDKASLEDELVLFSNDEVSA